MSNKFDARAHGILMEDSREIGCTRQCCHCGGHFLSVKGSGKHRSFCMNCRAVTCGGRRCVDRCLPFEKRLELYEAGKIDVL